MEETLIKKWDADDFVIKTYSCKFDLIYKNDKTPVLAVAVDRSKILLYAFSPSFGLCRVTEYGGILEKNILTKLVSLSDDVKEILSFFQEYGFLVQLAGVDYFEIDVFSFSELINRLKATTFLFMELGKEEKNESYILRLMMYLLLSETVEFKLSEDARFISYTHRIKTLMNTKILSPGVYSLEQEPTTPGYITIPDSIFTDGYQLNEDEYNDIVSGERFMFDYPGISDSEYKNLTWVYRNAQNETKANRMIIDFVFHYMHEVGVIKSISYLDGIKYYGEAKKEYYNDYLKKALIPTAKQVLSAELNSYISRIRPVYNPDKMSHSWVAPNLITALYFSLSYMNPQNEILRECANPSCNNFFSVKTTNSKKIYCCTKCRNAAEQREFRKRNK